MFANRLSKNLIVEDASDPPRCPLPVPQLDASANPTNVAVRPRRELLMLPLDRPHHQSHTSRCEGLWLRPTDHSPNNSKRFWGIQGLFMGDEGLGARERALLPHQGQKTQSAAYR